MELVTVLCMSLFEQITLLIGVFGLVLQILGFIYVIKNLKYVENQLDLNKKVHQDTLDWNKKIATESELAKRPDMERVKKLNDLFRDKIIKGVIPLKAILDEIKKDPTIEGNIAVILNRHERLARGINLDMYSEAIIASAAKSKLIRSFERYSKYIEYCQAKKNDKAWKQFKDLIEKWKLHSEA